MITTRLTVASLLLTLCCAKIVDVYPPVTNDSMQIDIFIGVIMSLSGPTFISSDVIPGIQLAVDLINNNTNILNGYTLHYVLGDSQVVNSYIRLTYCHYDYYSVITVSL